MSREEKRGYFQECSLKNEEDFLRTFQTSLDSSFPLSGHVPSLEPITSKVGELTFRSIDLIDGDDFAPRLSSPTKDIGNI